MQITFYKNQSDDTTVPKTLTGDVTITGNLKDATDLLHPVILISSEKVSLDANYCYIPAFGRYYFCTFEVVTNELYRVHCDVDVLQSFWDDVKEAPVIVERSRNVYNSFINDGKRPFYQYEKNQYINIGDIGVPDSMVLITVGGHPRRREDLPGGGG